MQRFIYPDSILSYIHILIKNEILEWNKPRGPFQMPMKPSRSLYSYFIISSLFLAVATILNFCPFYYLLDRILLHMFLSLSGYLVLSFFFFFFFICGEFRHTLEWNSHGFTCVPHPDPPSHLPLHPLPLGLPSAPGLSAWLMHPTWAGDLFHMKWWDQMPWS